MWNDVIVLCPHCLERSVLLNLFAAPTDSVWIHIVDSLSRVTSYNRHVTEATVVAVTGVNALFFYL